MPEPLELAFESFGARAESSAEISIVLLVHVLGVFVLQLIAVVKVNDCGPVPAGGAIPGVMLMVKRHVVFEGTMTPLSARRIAKLPFAPVPGVVAAEANGRSLRSEPAAVQRGRCAACGDELRGDAAAGPGESVDGAHDRARHGGEAALRRRRQRGN
jgi:hypothetical protein